MENERSSVINIGGKEYELLLTTKATKEIAKRYGGEQLLTSEDFAEAIDEIVWLITLLANQSILIHNLKNTENKEELLTEEMVELFTSPSELGDYKESISEALNKGTTRNVESETDSKKQIVG